MRPVCKGFYAIFTVKSQVSSVHNLMTPFFGALTSECIGEMAGSTSSMEAAERMLNIASVEPLLNQTVSDLDPQALSQTRRPYARAFF